MSSLANTERNQSKHGFLLTLAFYILFGHCNTYWHANNFAGQFQTTKQKYPKMTYHLDQKPVGSFISSTGRHSVHCWYPQTSIQ